MPSEDYTLHVVGLDPVVRGFGKLDKELGKEVRGELKNVAKIVSDAARVEAIERGLVDPKDRRPPGQHLVGGIKPAVRGSTALVRETATRKGFPYPAIYEYGGRGDNPDGVGPRAYLFPAVQKSAPRVERAFGEMLDRMTRDDFERMQ